MTDVRDPSQYSPASTQPGANTHQEAPLAMHGPVKSYPVESHSISSNYGEPKPPFSDPESF